MLPILALIPPITQTGAPAAPDAPVAADGLGPFSFTVGDVVSIDVAADFAAGGGPSTYALTTGALPAGLALDFLTGAITGTATAKVTSTAIGITGTNSTGAAESNFTVTVLPLMPAIVGSDTGTSVIDWAGSVAGGNPQAGDLLIHWAGRHADDTAIAAPAGFTAIGNASVALSNYGILSYRVSTGAEVSSTAANAQRSIGIVIRGVDQADPIVHGVVEAQNASGVIAYPALTLGGVSAMILVGHKTDSAMDTTVNGMPSGFSQIAVTGGNQAAIGYRTAGMVTTFVSVNGVHTLTLPFATIKFSLGVRPA